MPTDTSPLARAQEHAKLLRYADRQALAFLTRVDDELSIVVQLWCVNQDHQLRVAIEVDGSNGDVLGSAFDDLDNESLARCLDELGVAEMLQELETA